VVGFWGGDAWRCRTDGLMADAHGGGPVNGLFCPHPLQC
jgi:hypothetical protein